uniref:BCAA decarboxylase n=1 Tax=Echinacea purpurea TaxID=53751 RepID=A0A1A8JL35_ECHPU|nr:BCAA decarboxylase [Echinacea purpurea]
MGSYPSEFNPVTKSLDSKEVEHLNPEDFRAKAHQVVDFIADFYKNIENYPASSQVQPGYLRTRMPQTAPDKPESLDAILKDVENDIIPGITQWVHPNFYGYFPASISSAAFLGEMLCACFNANGFSWVASPALTELEMVVMDWFAVMLRLPKCFMFSGTGGGVVQATTSEAVLVTILGARDRVLSKIGHEHAGKLVVYGSDQAHSMYNKQCKIAGIHPQNIRSIPARLEDEFALSPDTLRKFIEADVEAGLIPLFLCLTVGTTSTTAVDNINDLADLANKYNIWVHVDAAYGGNACICPEYRHFLDGIEKVDSLSLSPHKWLLCYAELCCLYVKNPSCVTNSLRTNPEYLRYKYSETDSVVSYKDWQVGTSRRFSPLRLYFVLRSYGVESLQSHIRSHIQYAITFERLVKSDGRFELVVPRRFSLVCFRLKQLNGYDASYTELLNRKLLEQVNSTGHALLTHSVVGGIYLLRFVVGSTLTEERHVIKTWEVVKELTNAILTEV